MTFQTRSFSQIKNEQKQDFDQARHRFRSTQKNRLKYYILIPLIAILTFFILQALTWAWSQIANFNLLDFVWNLSSDIKVEDNHTNILLLGHSGGNHDGPDLTDTIIIATFNHKLKTISLLSLPRDLFISISGYEPTRINSVWKLGQMRNNDDSGGYQLIREVVESIINQPIHYYARVNFDGFAEIIDAVGGIDVDVDTAFTDYQYPNNNFGWQTITFTKGQQHMDGERALQFARSRHGNNGQGSDFQRALRQQKILMALRQQVLSTGILISPDKLRGLYEALSNTFDTDLGLQEVFALAKFGSELEQKNIRSFTLTDGFDGFLYTPSDEEREIFYNGWFILLPIGNNWTSIHRFTNLIWNHNEVYQENAKINILNGTGIQGLAQSCADYLNHYHFNPIEIGNASQLYSQTEIYDHTLDENSNTLEILANLIDGQIVDQLHEHKPTKADITIILGTDTDCKIW